MIGRPSYLTLPAIAAFSWALLDHLLPDLLPKVPRAIGLPVAVVAASLLFLSFAVRGWRWLVQRLPPPWFPRPFLRAHFWLRHRPSVTILTAMPKVDFGNTVMNGCEISLTVCRNLSNLPVNASIDFDHAELVFTKTDAKPIRRHVFRPKETGGFLALDVVKNSTDNVMITFSATRLPAPLAEAPDFTGDYELKLRGVRALVRGTHPFSGELPRSCPTSWCNCGVVITAISGKAGSVRQPQRAG
jgi:hypothetical protein